MIVDHLGNTYKNISEMCKAYNISTDIYYRRRRNGKDLKFSLTAPKYSYLTRPDVIVHDHLGNVFRSKSDMCEYYNIPYASFIDKIKRGKSLKDILTHSDRFYTVDHLGNTFKNEREMCKFHNVCYNTFRRRKQMGYSIKDSLTCINYRSSEGRIILDKPSRYTKSKEVKDHLGNSFKSISAMCEYYNITYPTYRSKVNKGWDIERILTDNNKRCKSCKDHLGNSYKSITSMCKAYNVSYVTYKGRLKRGMSTADALTQEVVNYNSVPCKDHLGNEYPTIANMCKKYKIKRTTFQHRLHRGWSLEEALTSPTK